MVRRRRVPGLNLTTDVIVGFPGEDEAAFGRTVALVEEAGVTKVHVFPFSARPGTPAAAMPGHLAPEVVREIRFADRQPADAARPCPTPFAPTSPLFPRRNFAPRWACSPPA